MFLPADFLQMLGATALKASFVCGGARLCEPQRFEMRALVR
jgi:hypothetical protein